MKRIIAYISIFAAALTAGVSCSREEVIDEKRNDEKIRLVFRTEEMNTRVQVTNGDKVAGTLAENAINYVDYFFFADNNPSSEAIVSGRLDVSELTKVSNTEYTYDGFDTSVGGEYEMLQGVTYLYVLVNYPGEVTANTMNGLLELPLSTNFKEEQTSFVMDSYDNETGSALIALGANQPNERRDVLVKLARVAAKLVLNVNVKNSFTDKAGNVWTPVTDQMWVNFVHARKNTTLAAQAVTYDEETNYYSTSQTSPASTTASDSEHTSFIADAVYTYPLSFDTSDATAPYFKISCPWVCSSKGMNNFYYKLILPELGSFQRNKIYQVTVDLSVIGDTEDDWAFLSKYIAVVDWWKPATIEASYEGAMYLDVPVRKYEIYGVDDVYIPVLSSNNIQVTDITGSKINLYNGNTVSVDATISDTSKEGFKLTHTLNNNIESDDFDCTPITFTMTVKHVDGGLDKEIQVEVIQYPPIYAKADHSNGYAYVNSYTYADNRGGRHSNTRFYYNANQAGAFNNRGSSSEFNNLLGTINNGDNSASNNENQYVITVSVLPDNYKVTGMNEEVVIGDPRGGKLSNDYLGYAAGSRGRRINGVRTNYDAVSSYTQNVIAPAIRIASSWGTTSPILNYDRAEERCASYQENGYPAGRWRVPTVAEIDFLIRLSDYGHIPELFSPEYHDVDNDYFDVYWAGGHYVYGGKPYVNEGGGHQKAFVDLTDATRTNTNQYGSYQRLELDNERFRVYMRCVYDEWYWSDKKYNNQGQQITGNETPAQQWLGYIFN